MDCSPKTELAPPDGGVYRTLRNLILPSAESASGAEGEAGTLSPVFPDRFQEALPCWLPIGVTKDGQPSGPKNSEVIVPLPRGNTERGDPRGRIAMPRELTIPKDSVVALDDGTFKVTVEDSEFEGVITEDDLRTKYVPKATHEKLQTGVEGRITSAVDTARNGFRTEAIADDEFLSGAIKDRTDFFKEKFPKAGEGPSVDELFEKWDVDHLKPLRDQLETRATENSALKVTAVEGARSRGLAESGVDPTHMGLMEDHLARRTEWSEDHNAVVIIDPSKSDGDSERVVTVLDGSDLVPQSISGYLDTLRESGKFDHVFTAKVKDGGGFEGGRGGGGKETTKEKIARLEGEGKFSEAAPLKEQLIQETLGRST